MRPTGMMKSQHRIGVLARLTSATGLAGSILIGGATPATASCGPLPPPSPNAFIGTVLDTDMDGRQATVQTMGGDTVTVVGTPAPDPGTITSVDRTYDVGATYKFHPVNSADPYEDNACTRTHELRGDAIPAALVGGPTEAPSPRTPTAPGVAETGTGATESSLPGGGVGILGLVAVVLVGLSGGWLWLGRR